MYVYMAYPNNIKLRNPSGSMVSQPKCTKKVEYQSMFKTLRPQDFIISSNKNKNSNLYIIMHFSSNILEYDRIIRYQVNSIWKLAQFKIHCAILIIMKLS